MGIGRLRVIRVIDMKMVGMCMKIQFKYVKDIEKNLLINAKINLI